MKVCQISGEKFPLGILLVLFIAPLQIRLYTWELASSRGDCPKS